MNTAPRPARSPRRRGRPTGPGTSDPRLAALATSAPPRDAADIEIGRAIAEERPLDLAMAFPCPPPARGRAADDIAPTRHVREDQLQLAYRLMMRGLTISQMAASMNVSCRTVVRLRRELADRMQQTGRLADPIALRGETFEFFNALRAEALLPTLDPKLPIPERLEAYRTALQAESAKQRFLQAIGFYDAYRVQPDPRVVINMNADAQQQGSEGAGRIAHLLGLIINGSPELDAKIDADLEREAGADPAPPDGPVHQMGGQRE